MRAENKAAPSTVGGWRGQGFQKREGGVVISDILRIPHPDFGEWINFEEILKKL